ncbi:MAG: phosphoribosylglycinamide formyltransferase [Acidobacteriota bacterium]
MTISARDPGLPDYLRTRVGILLSGRGSNFLALHDAMRADAPAEQAIPAEIACVVSNVPDAPGLDRARDRGLTVASLPHRAYDSREAHEDAVHRALIECGVEWVCLAGYMRILSPGFVRRWPQRMLNIHPSLLPAFPGLHAQRQALEHGVRVSGCTVHLVDDGLDSGPIVVQRAVAVHDEDDESTLRGRILVEEHRAYPEALRRLLTESWQVVGRRVQFFLPA